MNNYAITDMSMSTLKSKVSCGKERPAAEEIKIGIKTEIGTGFAGKY
jgi:hypothetical protein